MIKWNYLVVKLFKIEWIYPKLAVFLLIIKRGFLRRVYPIFEEISTVVDNLRELTYLILSENYYIFRKEKRKLIDIGFRNGFSKDCWNLFLDGSGHWIFRAIIRPINFTIKVIARAKQIKSSTALFWNYGFYCAYSKATVDKLWIARWISFGYDQPWK